MKKNLIAILLTAVLTLSLAIPASAAFKDVSRSDWFYSDVNAVEKYGIIEGVGNGRFNPNGTLTLSQAITMAARAHAAYLGTDIEDYYRTAHGLSSWETISPWYEPYLFYCDDMGLCFYGELGTKYDGLCSRLNMATLFSLVVMDDTILNKVDALPDCGDDFILDLYRMGILTGSDKYGTFHPYDSVTRAEAAAIINRVMDPAARKTFTLENDVQSDPSQKILYPLDYVGMTVRELADISGWNFIVGDGWWYGGAKPFGHMDIPYGFFLSDPDWKVESLSDLTGREVISLVMFDADRSIDVAPGLPSSLTRSELKSLDYVFDYDTLTWDEFEPDDNRTASYQIIYDQNIAICYNWYYTDPWSEPADNVEIIYHESYW